MTETSAAAQPMWLRILQSPLTRLIVLGAAMFQFMGWAQARLEQFHDTPLLGVPIQIALGLAAIALYLAYGKFIERRDVTELSTPGLGREWVIGALIGAGLYTACAVILMALGIYKVEGLNPLAFLIPNLALAIKSGVFEELLFRGVLFRSVEAIFGSWVGILVSSLVFGLLHLLNPDATLGGAIYICIEAGLLLAIVYTELGNRLFGTVPLPVEAWLFALPFALLLGVAEELRKGVLRWARRRSDAAPARH